MRFNALLDNVTEAWGKVWKNFPPWKENVFFKRLVAGYSTLFLPSKKQIRSTIVSLERELALSEKEPLLFAETSSASVTESFHDLLAQVKTWVQENDPSDEDMKRSFVSLKRAAIGLTYRLKRRNSLVSLKLCNRLRVRVSEWKKLEKSIESQNLDPSDLMAIQTTSCYPLYVDLMLEEEELFNEWARFSIRDKVDPAVYIEFPKLAQRLIDCNLASRIGRLGSKLKIEFKRRPDGLLQKIVTMPFDGKAVNVLEDDTRVELASNFTLTVGEAFEIFRNKNVRVGDLEYLAEGVTNWNVHKWGRWNPLRQDYDLINISHPKWWLLLPTFEIISRREAEERYEVELKDGQWCAAATATSLTKTLDYENTHAFLELAIPMGDGNYNIVDFGKFATVFPSSFLEAMSMFCHNLHATISFPDENIFYLHRARAYQPFVMNEAQAERMMDLIRKDMVKGMELNFVYQIESDNCAKWVHDLLTQVMGHDQVPEMFKIHLLDTEPTSFVAHIFSMIKLLPVTWQTAVMTFFHLPMGASRTTWIFEKGKRVAKSLTQHEFWESGIVYLPALLLKLKEKGMLGLMNHLKHGFISVMDGARFDFMAREIRCLMDQIGYLPDPHLARRKRLDQLRRRGLLALKS
ncbi:hypothetical protein [Estrella lausannensis]|uniref:Uncharacterized protein n=1 Tax=Estrella lausannensis TaxID=483423 RepID=A0A0H5E4A7_9BACT|nr:hypothetical protein [Estrella lausannensis]CRX38055.1 conserved hypothetical protein [Estrella lausannensis]